jgi:putative spermidine/putrescine transport system substrate-binding protein
VWVRPILGPASADLPRQWAEFWWRPDIAQALSDFTNGASPILQALAPSSTAQQRLWPKDPWFSQSEFLEPLPTATLKQYESLWQQMRR